jgi:hypothetical protein
VVVITEVVKGAKWVKAVKEIRNRKSESKKKGTILGKEYCPLLVDGG